MLDNIYNKIKKSVQKESSNPQQTQPKEIPTKEIPKKIASTNTNNVILPKTPTEEASVAQTTLTIEQQRKLLEDRRKIPPWILIIKYLSFFLLMICFLGFFWLKADLEPNNKYLSVFEMKENVGLKFRRLTREEKILKEDSTKYLGNIKRWTHQLETKQYSIHTETIQKIIENQFVWFDQKNLDGTIKYGILDSVERMQKYFNSKNFEHAILLSGGNNIETSNINADRTKISFTVNGANLFGKVFFLNTEFIKMMNSYPFFKNGSIKSFSKKKNDDDADSMSFSLKLEIQKENEKDPDDENFSKYEDWLNSLSKNK